MKRQLFETVKVLPFNQGSAFDRLGFLSAVMGVRVDSADPDTVAKISLTHCDTETGTYAKVEDERAFLDGTIVDRDSKGRFVEAYTEVPVTAGDLLNVDVDLLGCARYVKVNVEYTANGAPATVTAAYALTLGDSAADPPA